MSGTAAGDVTGGGDEFVTLGRISGVYGVRGWCKVFSYTEPRDNILGYSPLYIRLDGGWRARELLEGRQHGQGIVLRLQGCEDRDQVVALLGTDIAIRREQLPPAAPGEYYWKDLVGLRVLTREGVELGKVVEMMATGANDVMVVAGERERLIPFTQGEAVRQVNLDQGFIEVDWDPEF